MFCLHLVFVLSTFILQPSACDGWDCTEKATTVAVELRPNSTCPGESLLSGSVQLQSGSCQRELGDHSVSPLITTPAHRLSLSQLENETLLKQPNTDASLINHGKEILDIPSVFRNLIIKQYTHTHTHTHTL